MRAQPRTMAEAGAQRPAMIAVQAPLVALPTPLPSSSPSSQLSPNATQPVDISHVANPNATQPVDISRVPPPPTVGPHTLLAPHASSAQRSGPASTTRMMRDEVLADAQRFMVQQVPSEAPRGPSDGAQEAQSPQLIAQVARLYKLVQLLIVLIVLLAAAMVVIVVLK